MKFSKTSSDMAAAVLRVLHQVLCAAHSPLIRASCARCANPLIAQYLGVIDGGSLFGSSRSGGGTLSGIIEVPDSRSHHSANCVAAIDQCLVDGMSGGPAKGILDERANGGELYISDTTVRNTCSIGIVINPLAGRNRRWHQNRRLDR
jgi:hypothetical protein